MSFCTRPTTAEITLCRKLDDMRTHFRIRKIEAWHEQYQDHLEHMYQKYVDPRICSYDDFVFIAYQSSTE